MKPIPRDAVLEVSGDALKADLEGVGATMMAAIDKGAVALVRGFFTPERAMQVRAECLALAARRPPESGKPRFFRNNPDLHHTDSSSSSLRNRISALVRGRKRRLRHFHSYKLFLWNRRKEGVDNTFLDLVRLRNRLYGAPLDFATEGDAEFFTMVCVQHYRKGGGYLIEHSDADFHIRQGLSTRFEIIALLSKKGVDYRKGGLFVHVNGERHSVDDIAGPGDLVVYDVKRFHGVAPVDPREAEDEELGRWVILVPPFRAEQYMEDVAAAKRAAAEKIPETV